MEGEVRSACRRGRIQRENASCQSSYTSPWSSWHFALLALGSAQAATFTVNAVTDDRDANPGDGVCETAPGNGVCTLRAAIEEANALSGPDMIHVPAGAYDVIGAERSNPSADPILEIRDSLALTGAGASVTHVDGGSGPLLNVSGVDSRRNHRYRRAWWFYGVHARPAWN